MAESIENTISTGTQVYLGTPAGIVLCVDEPGGRGLDAFVGFSATLWHAYSKESLHAGSPEQMLRKMEGLFDLINYPRPTTSLRSFSEDNGAASQSKSKLSGNLQTQTEASGNAQAHMDSTENAQAHTDATENVQVNGTASGNTQTDASEETQVRRGMPGNPANTPRYLSDSELLEKRGKVATFIIRVQQRQNSDWQGRLTWVEKDKTLRFRTIMEMLELIHAAINGDE